MADSITILYGSETGTAQDIAEEIWKSAKSKELRCTVSAMDEYNIQHLQMERIMIFVVATTGQGEPPANMKQLWRFLLRKTLPADLLMNLRFGVLGLGDSSYQKYNFAAKKLNKRLLQLGGTELLPIGLADDQHELGIEAVVPSWTEELWKNICNVLKISSLNRNNFKIIERYNVNIVNRNSKDLSIYETSTGDIYMKELSLLSKKKVGTVIENTRTTALNHFQDVRLIKIEYNNIQYKPGDVLYVRPKNSIKQVDKFFKILNNNNVHLYPDMLVQVTENEIKVPYVLQQNLTLWQLVEQYWDLNFKPRKSTMKILSQISENPLEREKLHEFTMVEGQDELYSYINRPRRNILEVLSDFPHTTSKLNIRLLFEIMSPIKPRAFSIASSCKDTKNEIHILVAVVKYHTKLVEPRFGLCSNWLAALKFKDKIIFWIEKGTFKFAEEKPMILIGPGTGVAPFRSLLLEKAALNEDLSNCVLFFGCRNKDKDYHCKKDFDKLSNLHNLKVFCAFSRDQDYKIYVQHVIHEQKDLFWSLLNNEARIYLAGNSKNMPENVQEELINIIKECGDTTMEEATNYIKILQKNNLYQIETWN